MEYLLDTGVFYALPNRIVQRLSGALPLKITAGGIVPFELISGLPPIGHANVAHEFERRQFAAKRLLTIVNFEHLDLRTPSAIRRAAFGVSDDTDYSGFAILIRLLAEASTAAEFYEAAKQGARLSGQFPAPQFLRSESARVSRNFPSSVKQGYAIQKAVNDLFLKTSQLPPGLDPKKLNRGFLPYLYEQGDLRRYVFLAIASEAGAWDGKYPDAGLYQWAIAKEQELRSTYDGSIDVYIAAYTAKDVQAWLNGGSVGHNDAFDLDQLAYMRPTDTNQVFVTLDAALAEVAEEAAPGRLITYAAFLQILRALVKN